MILNAKDQTLILAALDLQLAHYKFGCNAQLEIVANLYDRIIDTDPVEDVELANLHAMISRLDEEDFETPLDPAAAEEFCESLDAEELINLMNAICIIRQRRMGGVDIEPMPEGMRVNEKGEPVKIDDLVPLVPADAPEAA